MHSKRADGFQFFIWKSIGRDDGDRAHPILSSARGHTAIRARDCGVAVARMSVPEPAWHIVLRTENRIDDRYSGRCPYRGWRVDRRAGRASTAAGSTAGGAFQACGARVRTKNRPSLIALAGCTSGSARARCPDTARASTPLRLQLCRRGLSGGRWCRRVRTILRSGIADGVGPCPYHPDSSSSGSVPIRPYQPDSLRGSLIAAGAEVGYVR